MHTYISDVLLFPPQWLKMIIKSIDIKRRVFTVLSNEK